MIRKIQKHPQPNKVVIYNNDKNINAAIKKDGFIEESEKIKAANDGLIYINKMSKDFYKLVKGFGDTMGPVSWDRNAELAEFADKWNVEYSELSETGKVAATIQFLRLVHNVKENEVQNLRNRKSLPPFSKNSKATLLHPDIMEEYLKNYNDRILDVEGRTQARGAFSNNQSFESIIKDEC